MEAGPDELAALDRIIAAVDERQALMAKEAREDQRRWERLVKRGLRVSPQHGAMAREFMERAAGLRAPAQRTRPFRPLPAGVARALRSGRKGRPDVR